MADTMNLAYNQTINNPTVNHVHQATVNHVHQATVNMQGDMGRTVLLEQSKADIETDRKLFVETEAHRKAMEEMTSHHCLLIIGSTGTGKTTQGHAILRECQNQGRTPFNLHSPAEWRRYIRGKNEIVLIDDIFGKDSYSHELCEAWSKSFGVMQTFYSNSGCFIVMTLRFSVREEALRLASGVPHFFKRIPVVDLNEHQFTESEKTQMLINHMEAEGKVMHQDDLDIVLNSDNSGSQFPTCCKEYAMMSVDTPNKTKIFAQFQEVTGGNDALQLASKRGQEEIVMGLLTRGVDVDSDSEGWTALHHACCEGHMNDVTLLLKKGAKTCGVTKDRQSPLHLAAKMGHALVVQKLIDGKADVHALNEALRTPLHLASESGHESVVKILLTNGADKDATDKWLSTPLHLSAKNGHTEISNLLIANGATVETLNRLHFNALHMACKNGHTQVAESLLQTDAPENYIEDRGVNDQTPLHFASAQGNVDVVRLLLEYSAMVDAKDIGKRTPLHHACNTGNIDVARILLESKADARAKDNNGWTSLHIISCCFNQANGDSLVNLLVKYKADVNALVYQQWTPLHLAAHVGNDASARHLIKAGARLEVGDSLQRTPLHLASRKGKEKVVKCLLARGANIHAKDNEGWTPMHYAAFNDHSHVITILAEHYANCNARQKAGYTPLHLACQENNEKAVKVLLENGSQLEAKTKRGSTPLHIACQKGYERITQVLLEYGAGMDG